MAPAEADGDLAWLAGQVVEEDDGDRTIIYPVGEHRVVPRVEQAEPAHAELRGLAPTANHPFEPVEQRVRVAPLILDVDSQRTKRSFGQRSDHSRWRRGRKAGVALGCPLH